MPTPTCTNIKAKFPEFADVDDATVEFAIEEAAVNVDTSWINDANYTLAIMYYTAHLLMVSRSRAESAIGQQVEMEKIGEISIKYKTPEQPSERDTSDLTTTPYGTRFLQLATMNFPPVAIV